MFADIIMCLLTAIYVAATICILRANKKSASAAERQIEESRQVQKQNVALQLLSKRIEIYDTLSEWVNYAHKISTGDMDFSQSLPFLHSLIFNNTKDQELSDLRRHIKDKMATVSTITDVAHKSRLEMEVDKLEKQLRFKRFSMLDRELKIIRLAEICFNVDYKHIKNFIDAYVDITVHIDEEIIQGKYHYANRLKAATIALVDKKILEQMKEEMKVVNSIEEIDVVNIK